MPPVISLLPLAKKGIVFDSRAVLLDDAGMDRLMALPEMAHDAAVSLITTQNNSIPAMMTTYIDPAVIEILTAPLAATEIFPEVKKGDFTTETATFLAIEYTGSMQPYGDFAMGGRAGSNVNFPFRQSAGFQVTTEYGDREVAVSAEAKINYVSEQQKASAYVCNRMLNDVYLLGVSGLANYGLMNDPWLPVADVPTTGAAGNTWGLKTSDEIYLDPLKLFQILVSQSNGLINNLTRMTMSIPPTVAPYLLKKNSFNVQVMETLKQAYPNLTVVQVPEFATASGNLMQLTAHGVNGQPTAECAFAEKMRAHGVRRMDSSFREKKSMRAWGTIYYKPFCTAQMLGI
jgi:hypothetical protein